ncbi:hypothetical protein STRIP9103_07967 [Streptomyces ipomoeae 91-03]|uniref:Uncharacterized protein n=1 Tax=Streptomyces ipomoeae 91-03 TaxID=698759 RepID=L1L8N8_9ACTN|nr:hypothetical protein STRIP9103_07967 [Streptomyces ipomoeae 91-03]
MQMTIPLLIEHVHGDPCPRPDRGTHVESSTTLRTLSNAQGQASYQYLPRALAALDDPRPWPSSSTPDPAPTGPGRTAMIGPHAPIGPDRPCGTADPTVCGRGATARPAGAPGPKRGLPNPGAFIGRNPTSGTGQLRGR